MAVILGDSTPQTLTGTSDPDTIRGGGGNDTIYGLAGGDRLYGELGHDTIAGGAGSDLLDGGPGADTMRGDGGNDVYVVNRPEDVVEEAPGVGGGTDTVFASVDFTLPDDVENLRLVGWQVWNAVGNGLDNVITGSDGFEQLFGLGGDDVLYGKAGNDALDGGAGADYMDGGEGDDVFEVDDAGDVAFERVGGARGGHDVVRASVDYTLGNHVEDLTLLGDARVGTGNGWTNRIVGNDGDNRLVGWGGDDFLEGGAGRDRLNGGAGNDTAVFIPPVEDPYDLYDVPQVIADLGAGTMRWELSSEPADQLVSIESIATGAGYDRITGSDGVNVISPGWGANLVDAGGGNDVIHGGSWSGVGFSAGEPWDLAGSEILRGGAGNDVIFGNGNAILSSGPHWAGSIDVMEGGAGDDRLVAGVLTASFGYWDNQRTWDGNTMTGGDGADRFEFSDDTEVLNFHLGTHGATGATVTDFDRTEGDKLVFDLDDPSSAVFVGETRDIGVGECGFYRVGSDTFVKYGIFMDYDDMAEFEFLVPVTVRLEDYAGPVTVGDVLFV